MPNIADLALKKHDNTTLTFTPEKASDGYAAWKNDAQGTFLGRKRVSVTRRASNSNEGLRKLLPKVVYPTIDGTGTKVYELTWLGGEFQIPNKSSLTDRQEFLAGFKAFANSTELANMVLNDDQYF